jgi:hypothetical protein
MPKHQQLRQVKAKSLSVKIPKNEPNTARLSWVLANEEFLTVEIPRWPAPGSEDTELGVLMELEVGHGETEVYPRVQA